MVKNDQARKLVIEQISRTHSRNDKTEATPNNGGALPRCHYLGTGAPCLSIAQASGASLNWAPPRLDLQCP